ncbi:MAG TPA: cytochrome c oxidase assembly protein [Dermatophilaceae bacterium]|jgi:cytochrome c oxidase assembly factor CtaG/putative copper export protein|nr:cytochrome c oxidase assembly protein [Dermatophilaceae bacterium]HOF37689.1 cytochrome c oxidase assembly protein [Dermatophilaceae bacterium]HOR16848.1 cytochrome c oxidase assembly protein [Dermatophilaceae bacterium]HOV01961.1 cytochrome c oxidase assembly protein [Dermatophilaceae bacterium]HPK90788.1 cytochrome c oxidase assembly protein [Dermatophilaceae bacterium]
MSTAASDKRPLLPLAPLLATGVVALAACLVVIGVGGAAAPAAPGLQDPGAVVRWGLPIIRTVHDLSAALTVGLFFLAAVAIPDRASAALARAPQWGVAAGITWVVSGLIGVVLGFANIAGTPLGSSGFFAQFQRFVWSVETLREGLISAFLAAIAVTVAAMWSSRRAVLWAGIVSVVAILPLALAGHGASTVEHETAVNGLAFHLVGTALWVGGLGALVLLRPVLGKWLPIVVERYSKVAAWSLLTVALSGVVSAAVRMSGLSDLATTYGAIILAKVVAIVVLGQLGLAQRTKVIARLRETPSSAPLFARLIAVELVVMGAAIGIATALARTGNPSLERPAPASLAEGLTNYPEPAAPDATSWLTMWRWDWLWGTVAVVAILLYVGGVVRLMRRGDRWPVGRTIVWVLGWVIFIWSVCGAPGVYGRVSFSWHMTSHMTIAMIVPILLVLAAPITLIARVESPRKDGTYGPREIVLGLVHSKYVAFWANPIVAGVNFVFGLIIFYYTPLFELALTTHTGHVLMVIHFLLAGYLFAMVLIGVDPGPRKWAPALRLVVLFATMSFHAFFGVAIQSSTSLLAPGFFSIIHIPWIPDPLLDQQQGGAIAWGIGDVPSLLLAMLLVLSWVRSDDAEARRHDRQADRDHDADLTAYNARLASIAEHDAQEAARDAARLSGMPREGGS